MEGLTTNDFANKETLSSKLAAKANLPKGILAGLITGIIVVLLGTIITVSLGYHLGYMSVVQGIAVAFAVRTAGKGNTFVFGVAGAVLTTIGCILGYYLSFIGIYANEGFMSYSEALQHINIGLIATITKESIPLDFFFHIIGIAIGYTFSFKH